MGSGFEEEDEDVVIQGSALHEHLSRLGYTDFESVALHNVMYKKENPLQHFNLLEGATNLCKRLHPIYSWALQEKSISKEQLQIILQSDSLLDDHSAAVRGFLDNFQPESWGSAVKEFLCIGAFVASTVYFSLCTDYKASASVMGSSTLFTTTCVKYSRMRAKNRMRTVVSLQNELHDLCKKGFKILRYGFRIKLNRGKGTQSFYELAADRLKYLQPLTESLIKYMEHVSSTYYQVSLLLEKLLPPGALNDDMLTRFENETFKIHGEINYQMLKESYHIYILVQSEMLHLLATAYNVHTWQRFYGRIPEQTLAYITQRLIEHLVDHKDKLSKIIEDYYDQKTQPAMLKHKAPVPSKWHDLYVHLYLTSNKLQLSYSHVLSILQDLDSNLNDSRNDEEMIETTMQRLNDAYKEIDAARNFAEFSALLLAKTRLKNRGVDHLEPNLPNTQTQTDISRVTNEEPEIMDEVFEEYIKEEYLKPLYKDGDMCLENPKWDKFLTKNFMTELKEALVDKKKSMAERESKALQRMYKNMLQDSDSKSKNPGVPPPPPPPPPPPMPPFLFTEQLRTVRIAGLEIPQDVARCNKNPGYKGNPEILGDSDEECEIPFLPLPKMAFLPQRIQGFPMSPFLQEESFVGSGENSEEEFRESGDEGEEEEECEDDKREEGEKEKMEKKEDGS